MIGILSFGCMLVTRNGGLDLVDESRHDGCYGVARDEKCLVLVGLRMLFES